MTAPVSLESWRQTLVSKLQRVRQSRFFHDRISSGLLFAALAVNVINLVVLFLNMPSVQTDIPMRYSSLGGFNDLGPWYSPVLIALFGLSVTIVNGVLAYQSFTRSRLASFYLLAGSVVVGLFSLIISMAFASVGQMQ